MKKILIIIATLAITISSFGQAKITTRKEKLSDFTTTTVKILLTGNDFYDAALRDAANNAWSISPFEFCTEDEFETLKKSDKYYFLLSTEMENRKGVLWLNLVKGGDENIDDMTKAVSLPVGPTEVNDVRLAAYFPTLLDVLQNNMERLLDSRFGTTGKVSRKFNRKSGTIIFDSSDIAPSVDEKTLAKMQKKGVKVVDNVDPDDYLGKDVMVSYVVAPAMPKEGDWCYLMVISTKTHELSYYQSHKISNEAELGFQKKDISKVISGK